MRRKRLKHAAQNLCQMFCGWQQTWSKHQLVQLGSGELEISVLSGECRFNGVAIPPLPIAAALTDWLREDLERHQIPESAILEATVRARLTFDFIPWSNKTTRSDFFWHGGEPAKSDQMHRCRMECTGVIRTDEARYEGEFLDVEEWPVGWPAA
jgi:hypothetical protein